MELTRRKTNQRPAQHQRDDEILEKHNEVFPSHTYAVAQKQVQVREWTVTEARERPKLFSSSRANNFFFLGFDFCPFGYWRCLCVFLKESGEDAHLRLQASCFSEDTETARKKMFLSSLLSVLLGSFPEFFRPIEAENTMLKIAELCDSIIRVWREKGGRRGRSSGRRRLED